MRVDIEVEKFSNLKFSFIFSDKEEGSIPASVFILPVLGCWELIDTQIGINGAGIFDLGTRSVAGLIPEMMK